MPPYTIRKSRRARHMRLAVHSDGAVIVTLPWYVPSRMAERFVHAHHAWLSSKLATCKKQQQPPMPKHTSSEIRTYTKAARDLAAERIAQVNQHYQLPFGRIAIRNQRTRWGSCSKKKNINFNYRIALLPAELADYIIVHELCHTKEFNHSTKFWALVAETVPEYKILRKRLREEHSVYSMM
ncbi:MAG: M48 family metallopeptidase [Patescibacteria group bacterium]